MAGLRNSKSPGQFCIVKKIYFAGNRKTARKFSNNSYLVFHEASLTGNKITAFWIAHPVNNALHSKYRRGKETFNQLFKTGYSSVGSSDKMNIIKAINKSQNEIYARSPVISVLTGDKDPTGSAFFLG